MICLETLNVSGMVKNRRLARHIAQSAWSEFVRQLQYKAALHGREIVKIGRFEPSSKTCSSCGIKRKELPLSVHHWVCECGAVHDRDVNAALNILAAGLAVTASRPSVSPESTCSVGQFVGEESSCL